MANNTAYPVSVGPLSTDDLTVVLSIYSSMTSIAQEIRQTVERLTVLWTGALIATTGWFLGSQQRYRLRVFAAISIVVYTFLIGIVLRSLWIRYKGVAHVTRNINTIQGAHEPGRYLVAEALMPTQWQRFGTNGWIEPIFRVSFFALPLAGLGCGLAVFLS
jgi:hypothetical protein